MDRTSQRLLELWLSECPAREPGMYTWAEQKVQQALRTAIVPKSGHFEFFQFGMIFAGVVSGDCLHVKTIAVGDAAASKRKLGAPAPRLCRVCAEPADGCECPQGVAR